MTKVIRAAAAAVIAMSVGAVASADEVTWVGDGSPDTSGEWSNAANWSLDVPTSLDDVILPAVTTGTRTVTQDIAEGTTIGSLTLRQAGIDGTNKLSLDGDLFFADASRETNSAFRVELSSGALVNNVQVDLNGFDLVFTVSANGSTTGASLGGTINFNSDGSRVLTTPTGHTTFYVVGVINATADGFLGRDSGSAQTTGNANFTVQAGGQINVSNGAVFHVGVIGRLGQDRSAGLHNNGSINVASDSTLRVALDNVGGATTSGNVYSLSLNNNSAGVITLEGNLSMRPYQGMVGVNPVPLAINNNGTWIVSGTSATFTREDTSTQPTGTPAVIVPTFVVAATGSLRGSSASDAFEYDEQTPSGNRVTIVNDGQVSPGAGAGNIGSLALRDFNLTFGETGQLNIDVGGTGSGQFDRLLLETGATAGTGAGVLDLSAAGDRLNVTLVNGFIPGDQPFSIEIATYGSVILNDDMSNGPVGFDLLSINGMDPTGPVFYTENDAMYSLSYGESSLMLNYTPASVPEPSVVGVGILAAGGLLRRRRR